MGQRQPPSHRLISVLLLFVFSSLAQASISVLVVDDMGEPVRYAMVSLEITATSPAKRGFQRSIPLVTSFTDSNGQANVVAPDIKGDTRLIISKPGFQDKTTSAPGSGGLAWITLDKLSDARELAEQKPANIWLSQLAFRGFKKPLALRQHFLLHCATCHQLGSAPFRQPASPAQWRETIDRMNSFGASLATDFSQPLADYLSAAYTQLDQSYAQLPKAASWGKHLRTSQIYEWSIGGAGSRLGGLALHPNGQIYITDQLGDKLYQFDPETGNYLVHDIPQTGKLVAGGYLASRFRSYHGRVGTAGPWGISVAPRDGHLFIASSMQQQILEFDPLSRSFTHHPLEDGYLPHSIRVDAKNRVWLSLALSSQVAMLDRDSGEWRYFDLPARRSKERSATKKLKRQLAEDGPADLPKYDTDNTGLPLPTSLDICTSDGSVWLSRLHADDIIKINPDSGKITRIKTPFKGPMTLRCDQQGAIWVTGFAANLLAKYDPEQDSFNQYPLPLTSETPAGLAIDNKAGIIWVNGNQSDTILALDIKTDYWKVYPMAQAHINGQHIEVDDKGRVYTTNSHFPVLPAETGQPSLIRIQND
jgi:streptogramin lyase